MKVVFSFVVVADASFKRQGLRASPPPLFSRIDSDDGVLKMRGVKKEKRKKNRQFKVGVLLLRGPKVFLSFSRSLVLSFNLSLSLSLSLSHTFSLSHNKTQTGGHDSCRRQRIPKPPQQGEGGNHATIIIGSNSLSLSLSPQYRKLGSVLKRRFLCFCFLLKKSCLLVDDEVSGKTLLDC